MIKAQRKIHRLIWLLLTPLLLSGIVYFSQPDSDLSPLNPDREVDANLLANPAKGSLP